MQIIINTPIISEGVRLSYKRCLKVKQIDKKNSNVNYYFLTYMRKYL